MSGLRARRDRRPGTAFAGPPKAVWLTGPTGAGSLRIQDTYRIDPNDLRSLPTGIAYIVTGGRAAKVAVTRGGRAPLAGSPRRLTGRGRAPLPTTPRRGLAIGDEVGPGDPALVRAGGVAAEGEDTETDQPRPVADVGATGGPDVPGEAVGGGDPHRKPGLAARCRGSGAPATLAVRPESLTSAGW